MMRSATLTCSTLVFLLPLVTVESPVVAQEARFVQNNDTIQVPGNSIADRHFTMEAQFRVLDCVDSTSRIYEEQEYAREDKGLGYNGTQVFAICYAGAPPRVTRHDVVLEAGGWHHLAFVRDGDEERLYLDGLLVNSRQETRSIWNSDGSARSVGAFQYTEDGPFAPAFGGVIDYVRVSSVARYQGEAFEIPSEEDFIVDADTQLLYLFNEADGARIVHDESPQQNDGLVGIGDFPDASAPTFGEMLCRADVNGSCTVEFGDLLEILGSFGPCDGLCDADIDGDGDVGFSDILEVLTLWGPCADS